MKICRIQSNIDNNLNLNLQCRMSDFWETDYQEGGPGNQRIHKSDCNRWGLSKENEISLSVNKGDDS
jgi:hypothetical protein